MCNKCQKTCDVNGNQHSDAFLDMDPGNKWQPSTVSMSGGLSPCEPFGGTNNDNNNNNNIDEFEDEDIDYDYDDDDGPELERPYISLTSSPPQQCHHHQYQQQKQQQAHQPRFPSTSSLDRTGMNHDHSNDSLDRVEFCSTTDYR